MPREPRCPTCGRASRARFVRLRCGACGAAPVTETQHARGGTSWHCPRCQQVVDPLDRSNHAAPRLSTEGAAAHGKDE